MFTLGADDRAFVQLFCLIEGKEELPEKLEVEEIEPWFRFWSSEISKDQVPHGNHISGQIRLTNTPSMEINGDHLLQEVIRSRRPVYDLDKRNCLVSDGSKEGLGPGIDFEQYMADVEWLGSETLRDLVVASLNKGRKFACTFYTTIVP
ncbi:hypothetical protein NL676_021624 [Syzygium grande]|nr:hypothetical protein NL676_021624 [Syzygium grande]